MSNTTSITPDQGNADKSSAPTKRSKGYKSCRGKGEGTLKLRGGIYYAQWTVEGKTYCRSTGTGNRREAEAILKELVAPFRAKDQKTRLENLVTRVRGVQGEIDRAESQKPALSIFATWDAYVKSTNRPDSGNRTLEGYSSQFRRFEKWVKDNHPEVVELRQVTQAVADEFISYIGSTRSANTYNKYRTLFSCMWEVLREVAKLTINPWKNIRPKVDVGHSRRELTVEELKRVVSSAEGELKTLLAIGIYTGLRLGDCVLLEWCEIDLIRCIISVVPRKTARHAHGKRTVIPINPSLLNMLMHIDRSEKYVLPKLAAMYNRSTSSLTRKIQAHFKACGIETTTERENGICSCVEVGFHSLRHSFVSLSANAGVPLAFVQAIVGHSNPAMTTHYFHKDENALKSATAAIPDVIDINDETVTPCLVPETGYSTSDKLGQLKAILESTLESISDEERPAAIDLIRQLMVKFTPTKKGDS